MLMGPTAPGRSHQPEACCRRFSGPRPNPLGSSTASRTDRSSSQTCSSNAAVADPARDAGNASCHARYWSCSVRSVCTCVVSLLGSRPPVHRPAVPKPGLASLPTRPIARLPLRVRQRHDYSSPLRNGPVTGGLRRHPRRRGRRRARGHSGPGARPRGAGASGDFGRNPVRSVRVPPRRRGGGRRWDAHVVSVVRAFGARCVRRIERPFSSMRWASWSRRWQMASAWLASPMTGYRPDPCKITLRPAHLELGGVDLDLAVEDDVLPLDRADVTQQVGVEREVRRRGHP